MPYIFGRHPGAAAYLVADILSAAIVMLMLMFMLMLRVKLRVHRLRAEIQSGPPARLI